MFVMATYSKFKIRNTTMIESSWPLRQSSRKYIRWAVRNLQGTIFSKRTASCRKFYVMIWMLRQRGRFCKKKWRRFSWRSRQMGWIGSLMTQFCTIILWTNAFIILSVSWRVSFPKHTSTSYWKIMQRERTISLFLWSQHRIIFIRRWDTIIPMLRYFLLARLKILPYQPKLKSLHSWS